MTSSRSEGDKQFWAPWERGADIDSLLPSDGGYSWWTGEYILGADAGRNPPPPLATDNLLENTDGGRITPSLFPRGGTLLPSSYADARNIDAVIVSKAVDHADLVVYEMATVLQPAEDVGVSFIPSPENPFAHPTFLNTTGHGGAACTTPTACKGQEGRFGVSRANLRFGDGKERRSLTSASASCLFNNSLDVLEDMAIVCSAQPCLCAWDVQ